MTTVHDVAAYIVKRLAPVSVVKLQKLVYYSQAWSLVWEDRPIFRARIEAWSNGPVIPELYRHHRHQFQVKEWPLGKPANLDQDDRATVNAVIKYYGKRSPQWLSELTHMERPWLLARRGLAPGDIGNREITLNSMLDYYGNLP